MNITIASYTVSQPKGGPLVDITIASYTISQPKGGPLVNITIATYCITAQGGTIGGHYHGHLLYCSPRGDHWWTLPQPLTISQPKGGPLVDITIASYCITAQGGTIGDITIASYCIAAQGGTIGGHHDSQLLYHSPRGDHWWTSRYIASCCITAQGGTIGEHYRSQLLYRSPKGGPLVDITIAS